MRATNITAASCTVKTTVNGAIHRKTYANSAVGRTVLEADRTDIENYDEVMRAWGDTPSVVIEVPEPADAQPTTEERIASLEEQLTESDAVAMALYEASLEQQTVNAEQDAAILGLYEMIGG